MSEPTPEQRRIAREWLDLRRIGCFAADLREGDELSLAQLIADRDEHWAKHVEGSKLTGEGSPGPLYTAGANQMCIWIASRIRGNPNV